MDNVRYNRVSVVLSLGFLLNLVLMPLKAYMSEASPFDDKQFALVSANAIPEVNHTVSMAFAKTLQARFVNVTSPYTYDASLSAEIVRNVVPYNASGCNDQVLTRITGSIYCPFDLPSKLTAFLCGRSSTPIARVGTAYMMNAPTGVFAFWSSPGDVTGAGASATTATTITFMYATVRYSLFWLTTKFCVRFGLSLLIGVEAYRLYYRHVRTLRRLLRSHPLHPTPTNAVRYEIVFGEPTSLVVCHPLVIAVFMVDFWSSVEVVAQAILRVSQTKALYYTGLGAMFLSRSVWFSYATLTALNRYLKWRRRAALFRPSSTTVVAMASFTFAGLSTNAQNAWLPTLLLYTHISKPLAEAPSDSEYYTTQALPASILYSISLCGIPFLLAIPRFTLRRLREWMHPIVKYTQVPVGGPRDVRYRLMAWYCRLQHIYSGRRVLGGSVYDLFNIDSRFRSMMTVGQNGNDCYVFGYDADNHLIEITRLSLLSRVDLARFGLDTGKRVRPDALVSPTAPAPHFAVGRVHLPSGNRGLGVEFGADNSPWLA
ncbi:hypothetical protein SDRG_06054 [Saprolegnia diclina VS20]|uniref:Uncharacterized protein n=1 Tax=Saprolegnia diclina (strain VS20) TaxID=1156394 RepID=T0QFA6_SAPDV|nr:hypothetical protein SDRG_06054 [Saprolegnia diclina VS20]EQC36614.1 hypothetical protein SDRG_06054 [Saprolegnia diclina VS20]|eukprot:XP_008610035.1 hypothetical protein SDRG_06054 [Saprolegnia diclina VS20]